MVKKQTFAENVKIYNKFIDELEMLSHNPDPIKFLSLMDRRPGFDIHEIGYDKESFEEYMIMRDMQSRKLHAMCKYGQKGIDLSCPVWSNACSLCNDVSGDFEKYRKK
jgi:hypothetical protein